jgi:hypothetical protein
MMEEKEGVEGGTTLVAYRFNWPDAEGIGRGGG